VTVENGEIIAFRAQDAYDLDDDSQLYPEPPWQLEAYMDAPIWVFRDSNWSPDFPTSAAWAEHFYAYSSAHAVDGVLAIDQEFIRMLLLAVGPVRIEAVPEPISADNVIAFMRQERDQSQEERQNQEDWFGQRKDFIGPLAQALLDKIQSDPAVSMRSVVEMAFRALDQRHLLVQVDDPQLAHLLAQRGWDGAMRPGEGDYLMVVDSNLGFNKVNAVVKTEIEYAVDLTDLQVPSSHLKVIHRNLADRKGVDPNGVTLVQYLNRLSLSTVGNEQARLCRHDPYDTGDYQDLIDRCYWNYLRVYVPEGVSLLDASPDAIPGEWMHLGEPVPPRVDHLTNDGAVDQKPPGLDAFGTLVVVPRGEQRVTGFEFALPSEMVTQVSPGEWIYRLVVQKQPGTLAIPIHLQIQLPPGAQILSANPNGDQKGDLWRVELNMQTDLQIEIRFREP
jgi:hypothetical protein